MREMTSSKRTAEGLLKLNYPPVRFPGIENAEVLYPSNCELLRCYHSSFQLFCAFFFLIQCITKVKYSLFWGQQKWHKHYIKPVSCNIASWYIGDKVNTLLACRTKQTTCFFITPRSLGVGTDKLFYDISHSLMFSLQMKQPCRTRRKLGKTRTKIEKGFFGTGSFLFKHPFLKPIIRKSPLKMIKH